MLTALKWSGTSVTVGSLVAATTVRVIAGGAGVVCAVPEAGSAIAPSNSTPVVLSCMITSPVQRISEHHTRSQCLLEWQAASSAIGQKPGAKAAKLSSWPSGSIRWKKRSPHSASRGAVVGWYPAYECTVVKCVNIGNVEDYPAPPGPAPPGRLGDEIEIARPCSKAGESPLFAAMQKLNPQRA